MVAAIIAFCAKNRFVVLVASVLLLIWAGWAIVKTPLDALPDISDTQVIIFTPWDGRSPNLVEDQITYPIVTTFLAAPKVKTVRGFTMFGLSFVFVIFEDGTDMYWARSRTLEYLSNLQGQLPEGVTPQLGPDATGVGWVFEYALIDETGKRNLQELRAFQDWYLRYWLASVPGVAEVAGVGGYQKEYQVEIDPIKLQSYRLSLPEIKQAIKDSNREVGGRVVELAEHEYAIRGRGYITNKEMLELVVVGTDEQGTPILLRDIAHVQIGGTMRRGLAELNGEGEVVGGIVVMRYGENALTVINNVKKKLAQMQPAFPHGVKPVITYDRSNLIKNSMNTLSYALIEEIIAVCLIIFIFLFHIWSALISVVALIIAVALSFIPMYYMGLTTNIMSLAGIIIAIGDVVDAAIIMIENAHQKIELQPERNRTEVIIESAKEIGPTIFGSLLVTVIAFLPVFALQAQEGRLFAPLAYTKTFSVLFGALLGITIVPALMVTFIRGKIRPAAKNPFNRLCIALYKPILRFCVRRRYLITLGAFLLMFATVPAFTQLGSEFMPPLDEEDILFMPITMPGISIEAAKKLLQTQDKILYSFPEVKRVFGKVGRADTATDPAPLSMIETVIMLHPKSQWRPGMTKKKLLAEMDKALTFVGVQNSLTMPIKARIDMLTTGIRTPIGVKVFGDDLVKINEIGEQLEVILRQIPGTRSVYAEREMGGFFIDFIPDRATIARYGLRVADVMNIIETSIGGLDIDTTIEGRERYKINIRYPRELRGDIEALKNILVPIARQQKQNMLNTMQEMKMPTKGRVEHVPLGMLGTIQATMGPPMIKNEMGSLTGWVYVDTTDDDLGGYVQRAKQAVKQQLQLPSGYHLMWTGQYEYLARMRSLMLFVIPITLLLILIVLFFTFQGIVQTLIVMLAVPCAASGAIWTLFFLGYNTSVAVWVGIIALLGIAAETAAIMMAYLDQGFLQWQKEGRLQSKADVLTMVIEKASSRVRPLIMAVGLNIAGLIPIMLSTGVGSDVAQRISAPLWGGLITLTLLVLFVIPAIYAIWRSMGLPSKKIEQAETK